MSLILFLNIIIQEPHSIEVSFIKEPISGFISEFLIMLYVEITSSVVIYFQFDHLAQSSR
jgi:hypothetical protein